MSDTPRTDAESNGPYSMILKGNTHTLVQSDFACQLERELNAANERVKRLEEAGDAMYHYCDAASRFGWKQAKETQP